MQSLKQLIAAAEKNGIALGHFNISELSMLKAIFQASRDVNTPVIIGTSEGEREFIGVRQAAALIKSLREEYDYPIFLNADHTHSLEKVEEAAKAGYDAILFDGGALPFEENIKQTKKAVEIAKKINPDVLIEGELGYIGSSSKILKEIPKGAAIKPEDLTKPEDAKRFVQETGVDLLAPAVGNIHGMFVPLEARPSSFGGRAAAAGGGLPLTGFAPLEPPLDIERVRAIKRAVKIPLVLHGGSGNTDSDFLAAIEAGISIIHISTELRLAWRKGLEQGLRKDPEEIAPYKLMKPGVEEVQKVVYNRLKLFNKLH